MIKPKKTEREEAIAVIVIIAVIPNTFITVFLLTIIPAAPVGYFFEEESINWAILYSIVWGGIGAINGSIYGLLIPRKSDILILGDKEWQIVK